MLAFLAGRFERLLWGAAAIVIAVALARVLKRAVHRLEQRRPGEERELLRLRRRETAIVLVATAFPYATAIVVLVVAASIFVSRNAAALGGTAFVGVLVGFAAQRFLMDIVAGVLIVFERWYGVGDFVMVEPAKATGIVEEFSLRTTILRSLNGDGAYVPNSQIITAIGSTRGYQRYSIELLPSDQSSTRSTREHSPATSVAYSSAKP
jgi:moderate conductance mechanosensitive channel